MKALFAAATAIATAITTALVAFIPTAEAIPFGANPVYRVGLDTVYFSGTAGSQVSVQMTSQTSKAVTANSCGLVVVNPPSGGSFSGTVTVGAASVNVSSLATNTLPTCTNGELAEPRSANFITSTGQIVVVGQTASTPALVSYFAPRTRKVTLNGCGLGKLKGTSTNPISGSTTFSFNATNYTVSSLTDAAAAPLCRTDRASGIATGYKPTTWP